MTHADIGKAGEEGVGMGEGYGEMEGGRGVRVAQTVTEGETTS